MNLKQIIVCTTLLHAPIFAQTNLLSFFKDFDKTTNSQLSLNQIFELNYLQEELEENQEELIQDWTKDEDIRIIIERTELAIQQSPVATQPLMKQRVVDIFHKFQINIIFTPENLIQTDGHSNDFDVVHPDENKLDPVQKQDEDDEQDKINTVKINAKKHHKKTTTATGTVKPLPKIKGANRTRKRLEREWKERHEAARQKELIETAKKSALESHRLESQRNADLLKKTLKEQMEQHQESKESEKTTKTQESPDQGM